MLKEKINSEIICDQKKALSSQDLRYIKHGHLTEEDIAWWWGEIEKIGKIF